MIQLTLTLKMTTAQVVETSLTVNYNSPIQDYVHQEYQTQPTFDYYGRRTLKDSFAQKAITISATVLFVRTMELHECLVQRRKLAEGLSS